MLDGIDKFSGSTLKQRDDLLALILAASGSGTEKELENAAFTAKYINGLFRVLKSGTGNPDITNLDHIKADLSSNLEKLKEQLITILSGDELLKERIKSKYLAMSQPSFISLQELLHDLEWTKKYLNHEKRK